MTFSLFALVLILAITFYQGLMGLFTSVINCILAVLSAALAFGLYEWVYFEFLVERQPDHGRAVALMAIFVLSLLVLRFTYDSLITGNLRFPVILDRAVGGLFGAVTGLIIIGVTASAIQMLPFSFQFLGHSRFVMFNAKTGAPVKLELAEKQSLEDVTSPLNFKNVELRPQSMWLSPDDFAVAVARHLSSNALQGDVAMAEVRPHPLDDAQWARFNPYGQKSAVALKPDALTVEAAWELPAAQMMIVQREGEASSGQAGKGRLAKPTLAEDKLETGNRYIAVRVKLDSSTADEGSSFRFSTGQATLLAVLPSGKTATYRLAGISLEPEKVSTRKGSYVRLPEGSAVVRPVASGRMDWVFSIPQEATPKLVEYKLNARAEVPALEEAPRPVLGASGAKPKPKAGDGDSGGEADAGGGDSGAGNGASGASDRISRLHANTSGSFFGEELPFKLTNYTETDLERSTETIINGKLVAPLDAEDQPVSGNEGELSKLSCASDKRLLHLSVARTIPGSLYGQVMDFASQNNNCAVKDEAGRQYPAVGVYAIATVGGKRIFDLHFIGPDYRISSAAIPKLNRVRRDHMKRNYELYYVFEVPAGAKIVRFRTPRNKEERLETSFVAPQ